MLLDTFEFYSLIQCGSGRFEVSLDKEVILTGRIYQPDAMDLVSLSPKMKYPNTFSDAPHSSISKHDLYTYLEHNGYDIGDNLKTVTNIDLHFEGMVKNMRTYLNYIL